MATPLVLDRLQQELMGIMMGGDAGASAFPNDDNLFEWTATLSGSEETAVSYQRGDEAVGRVCTASSGFHESQVSGFTLGHVLCWQISSPLITRLRHTSIFVLESLRAALH